MSQISVRFGASRWLPLAILLFAFPATAQAHTPIEGIGDFLAGLIHPLTTPSHILLLLALGLLLGQRSPLRLKMPMLVFVSASAVALTLTTAGWFTKVHPAILLGLALCAATFVALERPLPPLALHTLLALAALALGLDSAVESGSRAAVFKTLAGTWISLAVLLADVAIYVSFCARKNWLKVGVRVLGSWIIAVALLVLAFSLRS